MSGLCGIVRFDGGAAMRRDLERQMRALAHLGPDRTGHWSGEHAVFGSLLLRTQNEESFDLQPLRRDGLVLVADARLDNREELAGRLGIAAEALARMPDSALLSEAWRKWRDDCTTHLIGDFVFAVWDEPARTLHLVRDHMGQRHVFYYRGDGFFAFATEKKGLWALPDVPRPRPDDMFRQALASLGTGESTSPPVDIDAVRGGSILTLSADGAVDTRRYWEPHAAPEHLGKDESYYIAAYRRVLREAVECRLRRTNAPTGLFMGGGFDTSAICALAGDVVTRQGRKFIAASSVMPEDYRGTIRHARKWVEMCRRVMPHLDVRYVTREGLDIFTGMEQGFLATDGAHSPNRYVNDALYEAIKRAGGRVAMDGFGGDYTLNPRGQKYLYERLVKGDLRRFIREWRARRRFLGVSHVQLFRIAILGFLLPEFAERRLRKANGLPLTGPTAPIAPDLLAEAAKTSSINYRRSSMREGMLRTLRRQQNGQSLAGSVAAAAHGLEFTQPFHDKRVVELGLAIPEALYMKDGKERWLARQSLADLYPPEYQNRSGSNDDLGPDFLAMAKRIEPRVLAEIDRMEVAGHLTRYFDFPRMRAMLTRRNVDDHNSGSEYDTRQAMLAFLAARYLEWLRRSNA